MEPEATKPTIDKRHAARENARLMLEYLKAIIWPLIVIGLAWVYYEPVGNLLESGDIEIEVLGVKLKGSKSSAEQVAKLQQKEQELTENLGKVKKASTQLKEENLALAQKVREQNEQLGQFLEARSEAGDDVKAGVEALERQEKAAKKTEERSVQIYQTLQQQVTKSQKLLSENKVKSAEDHERAGFTHLLEGRFEQSLEDFLAAYKSYTEYHNVQEISALLGARLDELQDPAQSKQAKIEIFSELSSKWSWGMPPDVKAKIDRFLLLEDPNFVSERFKSSQSRKTSEQLALFTGQERDRAIALLMQVLLPAADPWSFHLNQLVAQTLAAMQPNWQATSYQYRKITALHGSPHYRNAEFRTAVDNALDKVRIGTLILHRLTLKKAGDIRGKGHLFFEIHMDNMKLALPGFPTRENALRPSDETPLDLVPLQAHFPLFADPERPPLIIEALDHDPSRGRNELLSRFVIDVGGAPHNEKQTLLSNDQEARFPEQNGTLVVSILAN